jgi:small multidrug resistance pump
MAIVLEVGATALLTKTDGFTNPVWTALVLGAYSAAFWLLSIIVRTVPVSVTYAIWSGVGTALVAVVGWAVLDESLGWVKVICLSMIIGGVVGLNLVGLH